MFGTNGNPESRLKKLFWKELRSDRTVMLGLEGVGDDRTRPMTAQVDQFQNADDHDGSAIYFFASKDEGIGHDLKPGARAVATFVSKGHGLFASIHGTLSPSTDKAVIDRLWNPFIDAWYKNGKDDPNLLLIKFDATSAEVWDADKIGTLKATALKWAFDVDPGDRLKREHQAEVKL